ELIAESEMGKSDFSCLALVGVPQRFGDGRPPDATLHEIVLGTRLDAAKGQLVVVVTGKNHDPERRSVQLEAGYRLDAVGIPQAEIQHCHVEPLLTEHRARLG